MGSKRALLVNGLGALLEKELAHVDTFADLFSGSGAVAWHVAENYDARVLAFDLQKYGVILAKAVIERLAPVDGAKLIETWLARAEAYLPAEAYMKRVNSFETQRWSKARRRTVSEARSLCADAATGSISHAYGGYYFSPLQSVWIDALRNSLPRGGSERYVALASLLGAAGVCCASPGHTAQPFSGSQRSSKWLFEAWRKDILESLELQVEEISAKYAHLLGKAEVGDAVHEARVLKNIDLAFVDPPYSGVQYSRFYHVLETIARGGTNEVAGAGRYPPVKERPRSRFSVPTKSEEAMMDLLEALADNSTRTIVTFPWTESSNGLSGRQIAELAADRFHVSKTRKSSDFSTLGGNTNHRNARMSRWETILVLQPKNSDRRSR